MIKQFSHIGTRAAYQSIVEHELSMLYKQFFFQMPKSIDLPVFYHTTLISICRCICILNVEQISSTCGLRMFTYNQQHHSVFPTQPLMLSDRIDLAPNHIQNVGDRIEYLFISFRLTFIVHTSLAVGFVCTSTAK